jgi:hypothetical protein
MNVHDAALAWHDAGACVLPAAADGSKRPALAWDRYKTQRPNRQELDGWSATTSGIGIVCGNVSGNIEMFEAEAAAVADGMHTQLMDMLPPELRDKLNTYVERSPKGGVHWIFRVDGTPVKGNTKLARRAERKPGQQTVTVLFETRGEGGWTVIAPSNGPTHPSGKPWQIAIGTAGIIPLLTADEYRLLHACAATFDAMPTPESRPAAGAGSAAGPVDNGGAPGSDFNVRATWDEILIPAGWTKMRQRGEITDWCRPGKNPRDGGSATTGCHGDWFYVFTTGTEFEPDRGYDKFGTYHRLYHSGDSSAAARELRKRGYGAKPEPAARPLQSVPTGPAVPGIINQPPIPTPAKRRQIKLADIPRTVRPVQWWWGDRMPTGALSLLAGREGIGKSVIGYTLVAQLTRGVLKGRWYGQPRTVIVCATEDSWEHTITPRLMAAGADLDYVLQAAVVTDETESYFLSLPEDLEGLEVAIKERGDVAMMLLDPLISRLDGNLDTHKDADVRVALEPLVRLADRTSVGVLGLIHVNKSGSNDPLSSLMGSRAFSAVARSVAYAIVDRDDPTVRLLGLPKNNLGRDDLPSLRYSLEGVKVAVTEEGEVWAPKLIWGEEDDRSVADLLADNNSHNGHEPGALDEAMDWLTDYLTQNGGLQPSRDVKDAAKKAGHTEPTLKRAARRIKIVISQVGFPRVTFWNLPGAALDPTENASQLSRARGASHTDLTVCDPTTNPRSDALFPVGSDDQDQMSQPVGSDPVGSVGSPPTRARSDWLPDPEEDPHE